MPVSYHRDRQLNKQIAGRLSQAGRTTNCTAPATPGAAEIVDGAVAGPAGPGVVPRRDRTLTMWWRAALAAAALLLAVAPLPPSHVEHFYSTGAFPRLQRALTASSNAVPFALLDALLVAVAAWWLAAFGRDVIRLRPRSAWRLLSRAIVRAITTAAAVYLLFLATWGLNYRRVPLTSKVHFDEAAITPDAARDMARAAVERLNALYVDAHSELVLANPIAGRWFADAFARAQQAIGVAHAARPGRPKRSLLDPYFRAASVEGMTDPFFLETLVAGGLLPFEQPAVVAHEWSHLAGFADEGEANFLGWLTCIRGSEAAQYSGWLFLYRELNRSLGASDRAAVSARLGPGPRNDLRAIAARISRQVRPVVSDAGWRVYDTYLKANRVEAGTASYAEVVRLVLGSRGAGLH